MKLILPMFGCFILTFLIQYFLCIKLRSKTGTLFGMLRHLSLLPDLLMLGYALRIFLHRSAVNTEVSIVISFYFTLLALCLLSGYSIAWIVFFVRSALKQRQEAAPKTPQSESVSSGSDTLAQHPESKSGCSE